jgi:F-type H+-transporting ATPase subunit epsilon
VITLEIVTPERLAYSDTVDSVVLPGSEGEMGVLPHHAPLLATLGIGEVTYRFGREEYNVAVAGGFAEVRNDKVIILADVAETPGEVDRGRAERARDRAEARLAGRSQEEIDYTRAMCALARALTRLQVAGRSQ